MGLQTDTIIIENVCNKGILYNTTPLSQDENTTEDRFTLTTSGGRSSCAVRIVVAWNNTALDWVSSNTYEFLIQRASAGTVTITDIVAINNKEDGGTAGQMDAPTIDGDDIIFGFTVANNGTSTVSYANFQIEYISRGMILELTIL